jgi:hypothetical protein
MAMALFLPEEEKKWRRLSVATFPRANQGLQRKQMFVLYPDTSSYY